MKIEDNLKNIDNWLCGAYDDFVDVKKYINQLEADKLELSKAVVEINKKVKMYQRSLTTKPNQCIDFIDLELYKVEGKATKYLGERSERD